MPTLKLPFTYVGFLKKESINESISYQKINLCDLINQKIIQNNQLFEL